MVIGHIIRNTGRVYSLTQMELFIRDHSRMAKSKGELRSRTLTTANIQVKLKTGINRGRALMNGKTGESILGIGIQIDLKGKESIHGQMVYSTKEGMSKVKKRDMVNLNGVLTKLTRENGEEVIKKGLERSSIREL